MENKSEKFKRLAEKRVNNVLRELKLIGNLSNKSNYEYSSDDVYKIIKTLKLATNDLETQFKSKSKDNFKL